jgi:hypothetical protein
MSRTMCDIAHDVPAPCPCLRTMFSKGLSKGGYHGRVRLAGWESDVTRMENI